MWISISSLYLHTWVMSDIIKSGQSATGAIIFGCAAWWFGHLKLHGSFWSLSVPTYLHLKNNLTTPPLLGQGSEPSVDQQLASLWVMAKNPGQHLQIYICVKILAKYPGQHLQMNVFMDNQHSTSSNWYSYWKKYQALTFDCFTLAATSEGRQEPRPVCWAS